MPIFQSPDKDANGQPLAVVDSSDYPGLTTNDISTALGNLRSNPVGPWVDYTPERVRTSALVNFPRGPIKVSYDAYIARGRSSEYPGQFVAKRFDIAPRELNGSAASENNRERAYSWRDLQRDIYRQTSAKAGSNAALVAQLKAGQTPAQPTRGALTGTGLRRALRVPEALRSKMTKTGGVLAASSQAREVMQAQAIAQLGEKVGGLVAEAAAAAEASGATAAEVEQVAQATVEASEAAENGDLSAVIAILDTVYPLPSAEYVAENLPMLARDYPGFYNAFLYSANLEAAASGQS